MKTNKIGYCHETINPIVGCSKISPACDNCYAEKMAWRLAHIGTTAERYSGVVDENGWTGKLNFVPSELEKVYKWKLPRRIFLGSMTDICHPKVSFDWYAQIYKCIKENPQHVFLLLTKRSDRLISLYGYRTLPNIWLGVTVENQEQADQRIPELLNTRLHPDAKRWISVEPMLGSIDLLKDIGGTLWMGGQRGCGGMHRHTQPHNDGSAGEKPHHHHDNRCSKIMIDWVVCGGENSPKARRMSTDWALSLYRQCEKAETPFWFKGWGTGDIPIRSFYSVNEIEDIQNCKELPR